jgi:soluble lytic murein transglycosylase-like protein
VDYYAIVLAITKAANIAKVSSTLLLAICSHESSNFTMDYAPQDHGTPSYGVCQVKLDTARMLNFKGKPEDLMDPKINTKYAALYLKYEQDRYGEDDWCVLAAAYNSGSYMESSKSPGYPKNLKYVKLVQKKLSTDLQYRLNCGNPELVKEDGDN